MTEAKRLFFGNPVRHIDIKPLPQGTRLMFGEPTPTPVNPPMLSSKATVLAYGNAPMNPQIDIPLKTVGQHLELAEKPRA